MVHYIVWYTQFGTMKSKSFVNLIDSEQAVARVRGCGRKIMYVYCKKIV